MSTTPEPVHLNNHHRNTLRQLLQHPASHNIEWHDVVSLLEAVGSVTGYFDRPPHKDIDVQTVVDLRRMLNDAGYDTGTGHAGPASTEATDRDG
jgi:hypothetical protein